MGLIERTKKGEREAKAKGRFYEFQKKKMQSTNRREMICAR